MLSSSRQLKRYRQLLVAFNGLLESQKNTLDIHQQFVELSSGTKYTEGDFSIGENDEDTEFGIYVENSEDHLIKEVSFTDNSGQKYGPFTRLTSTYDTYNFKTLNYGFMRESPFNNNKGKKWRYKVE